MVKNDYPGGRREKRVTETRCSIKRESWTRRGYWEAKKRLLGSHMRESTEGERVGLLPAKKEDRELSWLVEKKVKR